MKRLSIFLILISLMSLVFGLIVFRSIYQGRGSACEIRNFDHVNFLKMVNQSKVQTSKLIARIDSDSLDPLKKAKLSYFNAKLNSLNKLIPLVEGQITLGGSEYGCTDEGYVLLMNYLDYPTFSGMRSKEGIEFLWKKIEKQQVWSVSNILNIVLMPMVTLIVGILAYKASRKQGK